VSDLEAEIFRHEMAAVRRKVEADHASAIASLMGAMAGANLMGAFFNPDPKASAACFKAYLENTTAMMEAHFRAALAGASE
jgi:hypothetical protein